MLRSLVGKLALGITGIVIAVLTFTLIWGFQYQQELAHQDLLIKADLITKEMEASRSFAAKSEGSVHGLDPSEVPKALDELFAGMANSQVKQTRLVVRNDENEPDEFERQALLQFSADPELPRVYATTTGPDGNPVFRYMTPIRTTQSCLTCHGEPAGTMDKTGHLREGMKLGDLAGAMSVILPMEEVLQSARTESLRQAAGVVVVGLAILGLIWFILWRQVSVPLRQLAGVAAAVGSGRMEVNPEELAPLKESQETALVADAFVDMSRRLKQLYSGLEQKVAERTAQLAAANQDLEEANQSLAQANRMQSEFLTMISHEFRTPLTSIMTFTELLLEGAAGENNQEQQEYLTDVLESSQRLLNMVNDLLDLSRLEAGKIKLFRELVAVRDLVRDAERTLRPLLEKKGLTLQTELSADLPLVEVDPLRITQVILNLLGNAIKFTPEGGRVRVTARPDGDDLEVSVSDTGVGIAPEDQERIFEAFRQAGASRPEGSGLGLALARSLVEMHGGRIWLESRVGKGTTFRFTLPVCRGREDVE